jgi:hypothetical protein
MRERHMSTTSKIDTLFSGISNTSSYPPHNGLAVGPNNIVMAEGSRIEWTDLTGGTPKVQSVYSFFSSLGSTATNSLYDPRCIYDSASGRFIIIMENIGSNGAVSNIDIAVSKDSNPNDGWYFASLNTSLTINGQLTSSDRPSITVDGSNIYITAPQYNVNVSGYAGTETWVIGKTAGAGGGLYNGGTMTVVANQVTPSNQGIFTVATGSNGITYYACDYSTGSQIVAVVQAYNTATSTFGPATTIALGNIDQGGTYTAQQQGTTLLLDAGDKRIQNLQYANGFLWGVCELKPIGSSVPLVHWFKIDVSNPNSPALVAQGDISGASLGTNVATFNGSLAVDGAGDVLINFTASGPNMYPSDYYVYKAASDPTGTFSSPSLYQASTGFFNSGNGSSVQRWGAYSTAIPDPNNPNAFWISNEYVASGWWQTAVSQIEIGTTTNPTISSIATSGTGITNGNGDLNTGKTVTLTVNFSNAVTVSTAGGSPTLALNDGGIATYVGGSGSSALTFSYVIASSQNTPDLAILSANLNGATIQDQLGNNADLSGAANYNPAGILQVDTAPPTAPNGLALDQATDSGTKGDGITNITQVKIDGTAEPGSTVTLYDSNGTSVLGTGTANATTGVFAITTTALSSGTHTITAKSTDPAGNTSIASAATAITIDTAAPAAPTGLSLDTTTDSGAKGDGITSFAQIEIDGSATPGSTVTLYDTNGTTVIGTGTANATTGAFSITTSALTTGNHSITAKAADVAGNISTASTPYSVTVTAPTYDHIVVVIDENKNYGDVIGSPTAPFINSLVASGTLFTSYSAVAHPSEPNYFALFSGSTQGVTDDGTYFFPNTPTLAGELIQAGYTFTGYAESSSTRSHDPWESFGDSQNLGKNFSQFPTDYTQLPTVSFVIPNLNDDMHDGTVAQGDQWLSANLGAYATWAQANNSLLIVTFDESDSSSSNQIPTIIVGDGIPVGKSTQALNHYSLLHTIEDMYGLPGLTSNDTSAPVINFSAVNPPAVTSEIETQFSGISDPSSYPPHNALAVGSNYIVMAEGSRIEWSNLTGGASTIQSVYQFFKPLGTTATNALFDPRATYDSVNGRYIVTMDNIGSNGTISNIDIAVSKTSNPNDGWYFSSLNTSLTINGKLTSSDTPVVAVDGSNIYITAPQYNVSGGGWQGTAVWVIGDIVGAGGGIYNGGTMTVTSSEVTSPNQGIYRVVAGDNGNTYYASSYSTGGQIVVSLQVYNVATKTFGPVSTIGLGNIDQGGSYTAQQLGTSLLLDATDKRVQNLAYSNGFLYGVTEEKPIGSSVPLVHWFKIDVSNPNSPTLVAQGDISGALLGTNVATFNGSIAVNGAGDVLINFTASGPNMYPSDYYVYQSAGNGAGNFSAPILYQASSGFFNSGNGSSVQRWGINSTAIADPNNAHGFWVSNEYVANGWWQTSVTEITIQPSFEAPTLTLGSTALTVNAGGSAALPISVAGFDADDTVTVTIGGLTSYETITDTLDKKTFSGSSVTLTAAEVNSGLSLQSTYGGTDRPVNTLTITASNTTAGESATSAPQTITVTDPPAAPATIWSNWNQPNSSFQHLAALMEQYMAAGFHQVWNRDFGATNNPPPTHFNPEEQPSLVTWHHSNFS